MIVFLTDGKRFLGPYDTEAEPFAVQRGTRMLREEYEAADVYSVEADTIEQARTKFRANRKTGSR